MNQDLILWPALAQVALTLAVYVVLIKTKIRAIKAGECNQERRPLYDDAFPEYVLKINNNLRNQFELPVLFYVVSFAVWALEAVNVAVLAAAWLFVVSRVVHAWIHCTSNVVAHRRRAFTAGWWILVAMLFFTSFKALAEGVVWNFDLHEGLDAVMEEKGTPRIHTMRGTNFIRTRFVVEGAGVDDWTEAMDVLNTLPSDEPKTAKLKYQEIRDADDPVCPSEWALLGEDKRSVTFERRMPPCSTRPQKTILYRVFYGKNNVFIISATRVGGMSEELRVAWLALLSSAKLQR